jgi:hypothetical protein
LSHEGKQASALEEAYRAAGFDSAVRALWEKKLEQLNERTKRGDYVAPVDYATAYTRIGNKEQALAWLGRTLQERNGSWFYVKGNPIFAGLSDDPRFKMLLESVVFKQ